MNLLIKAAAHAGSVLTTLALVGFVMAVVPAPFIVAAVFVGVSCALTIPQCEGFAARVLFGGRRPGDWESSLVDPRWADLGLRVVRAGPLAFPFSRRTICVNQDLFVSAMRSGVSREEFDAVLAHAWAIQAAGLSRFDPLLNGLILPWRASSGRGRGGLFALAWRFRWLVVVVAVAQNFARPDVAVGLAVLLSWTYVGPWARREWTKRVARIGDDAVIGSGVGPTLAGLLRRLPFDARLRARIVRLEASCARPSLRLIHSSRE